MLGLQKKRVDQESRKHMRMGRHGRSLRHVVVTEMSEMCVGNREIKLDQALVTEV